MNRESLARRPAPKKSLRAIVLALTVAAAGPSAASGAPKDSAPSAQFNTTVSYLTHFYPLWFTHYQNHNSSRDNGLVGPIRVSPLYQTVVAINVDTFYASTFLDPSSGPVIVTIPKTSLSYSTLLLDYYGDTFQQGPALQTSGVTYALTGPDFSGKLPKNVTPLALPLNSMVLIFRVDKYSSDNVNQEKQAEQFRKSILMQPLKAWLLHPSGGATRIAPEIFFAVPFKTAADGMIAKQPLSFLTQLQQAVHAATTPPMTPQEQALSTAFDTLYAKSADKSQFAAGAQQAHANILNDYLTHTDKTNWISFDNMGIWGPKEDLDRSAIAEFIQYGNNHQAAAYYQAFKDASGNALNGANGSVYVLHIPKEQIPDAKRFWSFTAYTPQSIELVRNSLKKYAVARYTPNLQYGADKSVTIYMSNVQPPKVPQANWLPAPAGPFNVMLRVYGPQGSVADGTYVPPAIVKK